MKLSRRLSYNLTQISYFRKMKFNDERENREISERTNTGEKLKSRNSLKFLNSSNSSNDSKKESIFNLSEESKNDNNESKNSNKKNEYIIKEEDENNISENCIIKNKEEIKVK